MLYNDGGGEIMKNSDLIKKYKEPHRDLCCSETIFHAANEKYNLGFTQAHFSISSAFCGGNITGDTCGLLTASVAIIGVIFNQSVSHKSLLMRECIKDFKESFLALNGEMSCSILKPRKIQESGSCYNFTLEVFELLDQTIKKYKKTI